MSAETRRNTALNEGGLHPEGVLPATGPTLTTFQESRPFARPCKCRNNKSPSDLDADDEDNQEYDSAVTQSDGGRLTEGPPALLSPRPWAGESNDQEEAGNNPQHRALGGTMVQEAERVQEEVRRLVQLLKEKELRIHSLERRVLTMAKALEGGWAPKISDGRLRLQGP
ncbi:uncharacterized protein LOC144105749 isoform X4 [Amblyomma americanum]